MVHNPSNLYGGNAVVVNSQPSTNLAIQLLAKQQAKKDALNQYYSKLSDNTATEEDKMRPIDIQEGWGKKLNDYQTFFMNPDNKSKILKPSLDGYKTLNQFNAMHTDLIADARNSKDRLAQEKLVNVHRLSGKWNPTDSDMNETHNLSKSIYDPTRLVNENDPTTGMPITREPSVNNLSVNVPAYDANKESQFSKSAIGGVKTGKTYDESNARVDKKTGEIYLPYKEGYTSEAMKSIADNAGRAASVKNTPANVYYDHLKDDANFVSTANPAYQSVYGKTNPDGSENIIDTPQKAAAADYLIKSAQSGKTGEDKVTDWQTKQRLGQQFSRQEQQRSFDHAVAMQKVGFDHTDAKSEKEQTQNNQWIDGFINDGVSKSKNYPVINGVRTVPLDPVSSKALAKGQIQPSAMSISDDGNIFTPIYPTYDASGNPTPTPNASLSQPMDRNGIKLALGYKTLSKKDLGNAMKQETTPEQSYNVKGKTYSHKDLLNGGWTEDQINKAVKSGKIK